MDSSVAALLTDRFYGLENPRTGRATLHELTPVVVKAMCAVICGADSWVDVGIFGKSMENWPSQLPALPNGVPSHDTLGYDR